MARRCIPLGAVPALGTLLFLFFLTTAIPSRGQTFWPDLVDTVEVRAPRPDAESMLAARSVFSTVVPLGAEVPAGRDLADLLDRVAGLHVHRYGGLGGFAQASVRGSAPGQVAICLDGVPIGSAGDGVVDLALLPAGSFDHAEILRGPQVSGWGGPPAAGVINLVTPRALTAPLTATAGAASFGTTLGRASWGGTRGIGAGFLSGQWRRSDGDYPYRNRNGTLVVNTADDRTVRRSNNDFEDLNLLWKGSVRAPSRPGTESNAPLDLLRTLRADYTGRRFDRAGGVPGTENLQTRSIRLRTERTRHQVELRGAWLAGFGPVAAIPRIEAGLHRERSRDRYANPEGEAGLSRSSTDNRTLDRGGRFGLSIQSRGWRGLLPVQEIRASLEQRTERWTPHDRLRSTTGFTRARRHRTLVLEDRAILGRWSFETAYRWARASDNYAGPVAWGQPAGSSRSPVQRHEGPAFGARFDAGRGLVLKANHGLLARFPTFPELFGQSGVQDGNPELRSERGMQWDAGFAYAPRRPVRLEAAFFESVVQDRIALLQNSQRSFKAQNLDRSWVRGVEANLFAGCRLPARLQAEIQGSYTWQATRDLGQSVTYRDKELPYLPAREGFVATTLRRGRWDVRWELSTRSGHFRDRYNSPEKRTPASAIHDLALTCELAGGDVRARAEVRNLEDRRVEDQDGFPLPGRLYAVELTFSR